MPAVIAAQAGDASQALQRGDPGAAARIYGEIVQRVRADLQRDGVSELAASPFLADLHHQWGRALLEAGAAAAAVTQLETSVRLQAHADTLDRSPGAIGRARSALMWGQQMARSLNASVLLYRGDGAALLDAALAPRVPQARHPAVTLAQAYGATGASQPLAALQRGTLAAYLASLERDAGGDHAAVSLFQLEADLVHLSGAQALAGDAEGAKVTLARALQANTQRLRRSSQDHSLVLSVEPFAQRRLIAGALVSRVLGEAGHDPRETVGELLAAKAQLPSYLKLRRQLMTHAPMRARSRIAHLERELSRLPVEGPSGLTAWVDWSNRYAAAWLPVLPSLAKAGLPDFVWTGAQALEVARGASPQGSWIGFSSYYPVDPRRAALQEPRYVRYTVSAAGATLQDLGSRMEIDQLVGAWRQALASGVPAAGEAAANRLAKMLLGGLSTRDMASRQWVIEPEGMLHLVPFEALRRPDGQLVLDAHEVRYATAADMDGRGATAQTELGITAVLVLADPAYAVTPPAFPGDAGDWRTVSGARLSGMRLQDLPDTRQEAQTVAAAVRRMGMEPTVLLGGEATSTALRQAQTPRILHIASHALLLPPTRAEVGVLLPHMLAALALATADPDPLFWAQDALAMDLRGTQLVVLSACDTGNGTVDTSDALVGLRSAFAQAGARATLSSLWPVRSAPTTRLMALFYEQLAAGKGHALALQQAKQALRDAGAPVLDWAAFVVHGMDR